MNPIILVALRSLRNDSRLASRVMHRAVADGTLPSSATQIAKEAEAAFDRVGDRLNTLVRIATEGPPILAVEDYMNTEEQEALVSAAASAIEAIGEDELERYAEERRRDAAPGVLREIGTITGDGVLWHKGEWPASGAKVLVRETAEQL